MGSNGSTGSNAQRRVILVSGAASGMGRLAAERHAAAGDAVAALDRDGEGLEELADGRPGLQAFHLDVTDAASVQAAVKEAESALGPLDRVYNAAGIQPTGHILDMDLSEIHRIMQVNYGGVVNVAKAVLPGMLERGRGDLVNFGSVAGWVPNMHFGPYAASKFAVVAFTEVLYHENRGRGVRICCACPSTVATPLRDQARSKPKIMNAGPVMQPAEVLDAIEKGLDAGRLFVFGRWQTALGYRLRRLLPGLMWRIDHATEGY